MACVCHVTGVWAAWAVCVSWPGVGRPVCCPHPTSGPCLLRSFWSPCVIGTGSVHTCPLGSPCPTRVTLSLVCWPSSEGTLNWPDLLSDPSIMGSTLQRLARGRTGHTLGPEDDGLSLLSPSSPAKYFSASGGHRPALPGGPRGGGWRSRALPDVHCSCLQMRT